MKALLIVILASAFTARALPAQTLRTFPTLAEARVLLGSDDAEKRKASTAKIWQGGEEALPMLQELTLDPDPEIANRAGFILRRLRMGLRPDSPPALLDLAERLERAKPDQRSKPLKKLLAHSHGTPIALHLLNHWASRESGNQPRFLSHARLITQALLEQRGDWQQFFTSVLSPRCRAAIILEVAADGLPMQRQLIAILARQDSAQVYQFLKEFDQIITPLTSKTLARSAIAAQDLPLAMRILSERLATAATPDLARAIAFLSASTGLPLTDYEGKWQHELRLFEARLRKDHQAVKALNASLQGQPFLAYENHLLSAELSLPNEGDDAGNYQNSLLLKALHASFASPPHELDIESLSAEILVNRSALTHALILLSHPLEASDQLSANEQMSSAVTLLWLSKNEERALEIAQEEFRKTHSRAATQMRLLLAQLYLKDGRLKAAQAVYQPLLCQSRIADIQRGQVITLGLQLYPDSREKILPLAPSLRSPLAYERATAIALFLPYPEQVALFWYEHFRQLDATQSPSALLKRVEHYLENERESAREIITKALASLPMLPQRSSHPLYQNALFLQHPAALGLVQRAAWFQLSTRDLLALNQDESWPLESRQEALASALLIDPLSLRAHRIIGRKNQNEATLDSTQLRHLTLGDASHALELASLSGRSESLALAAEVADLRKAAALRGLTTLAKSRLENGKAAEAARFYQAALCGELAAGSQPASPMSTKLENLNNYLRARRALAHTKEEKEQWQSRLKRIGQDAE